MKLLVEKSAYADVQDWLGCENLHPAGNSGAGASAANDTQSEEKWFATATLPIDDVLAKKILSLGAGVKVLEPQTLQKKTAELAAAVAKVYS